MIYIKAKDIHDLRRQLHSMFSKSCCIDKSRIDLEKLVKAEPYRGVMYLKEESNWAEEWHAKIRRYPDSISISIPTRFKEVKNISINFSGE